MLLDINTDWPLVVTWLWLEFNLSWELIVSHNCSWEDEDTPGANCPWRMCGCRKNPPCWKRYIAKSSSVVRRSSVNTEVNTELGAVTKQRLVKTQQTEDLAPATVNCKMCELAIALKLHVVTIYKVPKNPITKWNPVSSHLLNDTTILSKMFEKETKQQCSAVTTFTICMVVTLSDWNVP
jgi:hypothetical protein